ncbi:MAG TPA: glycosyltransferase family 9 protein [Tepidisphaeraceae bacterium]|jgi:ADP-heptose:LPS heptosyltransferase
MELLRNVLIFHAGALGDFILSWPLAAALGRLYPQSRIIYVTAKSKGALAEKVLRLESADLESCWHALFSPDANLSPPQQRLLAGSHTIFSFLAGESDVWTQNVRRLATRAQVHLLCAAPPPNYPAHATTYLLDQLKPSAAIHAATDQLLRSIADRGLGTPPTPPTPGGEILIHPGSGGREKCWPADRFLQLIDALQAGNSPTRTILGEVELERFPAEEIERFRAAGAVSTPSTYLDLLKEFSSARLVIGNDSGPAHLAGIIALPTLTLFGPTDPAVWRPLGPRVRTVRHQPLADLPVDRVLAAALQMLDQ